MSSSDIKIYVTQSMTLQSMKAQVAKGYSRYVAGEISIEKSMRLVQKFDDLFAVSADSVKRSNRRRQGWANARLYMYRIPGRASLNWYLLVTNGRLDSRVCEAWLDAAKNRSRLEWSDRFVLRRTTIPKAKRLKYKTHNRKTSNAPWTWYMQDDFKRAWRERLRYAAIRAAGGNVQPFRQALEMLLRLPIRERGITDDVHELTDYFKRRIRSEFGKNRKKAAAALCDQVVVDPKGGYGQKKLAWQSLSSIVKRYELGLEWWPGQNGDAFELTLNRWLSGSEDW